MDQGKKIKFIKRSKWFNGLNFHVKQPDEIELKRLSKEFKTLEKSCKKISKELYLWDKIACTLKEISKDMKKA